MNERTRVRLKKCGTLYRVSTDDVAAEAMRIARELDCRGFDCRRERPNIHGEISDGYGNKGTYEFRAGSLDIMTDSLRLIGALNEIIAQDEAEGRK